MNQKNNNEKNGKSEKNNVTAMNRKSKQLHIINKLKKTSKYENKV
jgi:hypothetical protein